MESASENVGFKRGLITVHHYPYFILALFSFILIKIIAVDCRNHGESEHSAEMSYPLMCHDIKNTLTQLDIPKAVVIGHSMGGKLAMTMALTMPSYVEKVIVVDVSPFPSSLNRLDEFQGYLQAMINVDFSQVKTRSDVDSILATSIPVSSINSISYMKIIFHV